jgi:hypothetical protein
MATTMNGGGVLGAPERNNFFYGKLMDVTQFEKEQRYFNQKRLLVNRLVLGTGVVCGLNVVADAQAAGMVRIMPGAAIDGWGREIVVAEEVPVDPHQLTDDQGTPVGDPITGGTVTICLAFAEDKVDQVPVLVPDCDTPGNCAPSTIREGFRVLVRVAEAEAPQPAACNLGEFPLPTNGDLHELLCERINNTNCSAEALADASVPLARVTLDDGSIDSVAGRRLVCSNALLYELILCLAERVAALVG